MGQYDQLSATSSGSAVADYDHIQGHNNTAASVPVNRQSHPSKLLQGEPYDKLATRDSSGHYSSLTDSQGRAVWHNTAAVDDKYDHLSATSPGSVVADYDHIKSHGYNYETADSAPAKKGHSRPSGQGSADPYSKLAAPDSNHHYSSLADSERQVGLEWGSPADGQYDDQLSASSGSAAAHYDHISSQGNTLDGLAKVKLSTYDRMTGSGRGRPSSHNFSET